MSKKPIKVSDRSQPIKIILFVIAMASAGVFANKVLELLKQLVENTAK